MGTLKLSLLVFLHILLICEFEAQKFSCKVVPLKARPVIKAKIIFSGTVTELIDGKFPRRKIFAAKVLIKRVFRGPTALENRIAVVENLGNPRICVANPKVNKELFYSIYNIVPYHMFYTMKIIFFRII